MTRAFLKGLGLESDVIDKIMSQNGDDIEREKSKAEDKDEKIKSLNEQIKTLNETVVTEKAATEKALRDLAAKPEGEDFKEKYETEVQAHSQTKIDMQKIYDDYVSEINGEKEATFIRGEIISALKGKGANANVLEKEMFRNMLNSQVDISKAKITDGKIENIDELITPFMDGLDFIFGETVVKGANPATPPPGLDKDVDLFAKGFDEG